MIITPTPVATPSPSPVIKGTPVPIVKPPVSQNSVSPIAPSVKQARQGNFRRKKVVISSIKIRREEKLQYHGKKQQRRRRTRLHMIQVKNLKIRKQRK